MMGVFVQVNGDSPNASRYPIGYVIEENGCWAWVGRRSPQGYGHWWARGRTRCAHREMYERMVGPVASDLTIDHRCRNRICVNPAHLEPVSNRENVLRGNTIPARNAAKTRCPAGHEYSGTNVFLDGGYRKCRACCNARNRAAYAASVAAKQAGA